MIVRLYTDQGIYAERVVPVDIEKVVFPVHIGKPVFLTGWSRTFTDEEKMMPEADRNMYAVTDEEKRFPVHHKWLIQAGMRPSITFKHETQ